MDENQTTPLPPRTVRYVTDPVQLSETAIRGMISNPVYAGVPPYRRAVSDEAWVRAASQLINEEGVEQFLVNMLYMLKTSMVDVVPDEAIPEDYDGPWPNEADEDDLSDNAADDDASPWQHPLEGTVFCSHDGSPMIFFGDEMFCTAEYLMLHINGAPVTDLITDPVLTLVFQNGHTLPLLCPDCGESLHIDDDGELLDDTHGLTLVEVEWDADTEGLMLGFGWPAADDPEEIEVLHNLTVHLDTVRQLTCPSQSHWHEEEV
jgi:hypothetical protein